MLLSTIAAVSTPRGKGGVAVLRISGAHALDIADSVFRCVGTKEIRTCPRVQLYGEIIGADGAVLDDGLLCYFPGPHSYTGEDVIEVSCHGGEIVTACILEAILSAGAVMAGPGEFSRRAYMNGKLSLTEAEGVADLLDAKTPESAFLSSKTARGSLSARISEIVKELLEASASLWVYLDYPEEDLQTITDGDMILSLIKAKDDLDRLIDSYRAGRAVNSGVTGVILGKPNVGKSTFFNALLGEDRSIVTDLPGTTRDTVDAPLRFGRILVNLADTAGVRCESPDLIERIGIQRSIDSIQEADLIFALFDASTPFDREDAFVLQTLEKRKPDSVLIPLLTKSDLLPQLDEKELPFAEKPLSVSLKGVPDLTPIIDRVEEAFITDEKSYREGAVISNARQKAVLKRAFDLIDRAICSIKSGSKDLATLDLEEALATLKETDGKSASEEILHEVFSRFCVGK